MPSFAQKIEQAWQQQASWLKLLRPLSYAYRGAFLWQKKRLSRRAYRAPVPVMIIGNITVGGSGKTPLIIALVQYLQQHQVNVAVISRGYGGKGSFPCLVHRQSLPSQVGDEPCLIVQQTQVPMAVGADRRQAIELLLRHYPQTQLILSDDGLQHFALQRDLEWVVVDGERGFGNKKLLPEGFLREPLSRLNEVTVIEHHRHSQAPYRMFLQAGQPYCLGNVQAVFDVRQRYHAVVGIGYPQRFLDTLQALNVQYQAHIFPDHHAYCEQDFSQISSHDIITTAKDAVKLQQLWHQQPERLNRVWVVPVTAQLSPSCFELLKMQLQNLNIEVKTS